MKKAVILDFDGTLANTAHVLQVVYNQMAKENGWPHMSSKDYIRLRKGTLREALEWAGIHPWQLPLLLYKGRKRFFEHIDEITLFTGMETVVKDLKRAGWDLFVLSQNGEKAIKAILTREKLAADITVLPRASLLGKHRNLSRFFRKYPYKAENVWMIGDEVRDVIASEKASIRSVAVTWGLQDKAILRSAKPTYIVEKPEDIIAKLC